MLDLDPLLPKLGITIAPPLAPPRPLLVPSWSPAGACLASSSSTTHIVEALLGCIGLVLRADEVKVEQLEAQPLPQLCGQALQEHRGGSRVQASVPCTLLKDSLSETCCAD
jgi:hypothetical protein